MSIWQALLQALAACMVVSIVCRAVKMTSNTRAAVRFALIGQGAAAALLATVPFGKPHWLPWLVVLYMAAGLVVQLATASYWRSGTPPPFERAPGDKPPAKPWWDAERAPIDLLVAAALIGVVAAVVFGVPAAHGQTTPAPPACSRTPPCEPGTTKDRALCGPELRGRRGKATPEERAKRAADREAWRTAQARRHGAITKPSTQPRESAALIAARLGLRVDSKGRVG